MAPGVISPESLWAARLTKNGGGGGGPLKKKGGEKDVPVPAARTLIANFMPALQWPGVPQMK